MIRANSEYLSTSIEDINAYSQIQINNNYNAETNSNQNNS